MILGHDDELDWLLQNINEQSATQRYPLGARLQVGNRVFRYAHLSADAEVGEKERGLSMGTSDAGIERGAFLGAIVEGAKTVTWTTVAGVVVDQFKDGYILMQGGFVHKIKSNTVGAAALAVITLTLYEAFTAIEALPAGRYGLLLECPYANLRGFTIAGAGRQMGVVTDDYDADVYVWVQTWGPCGIIATPVDMGDAMDEIEMAKNQVGEEVSNKVSYGAAAHAGYQTMGQSWVGGGGVNWESENFIHIWLTIDP